MKRNIIIMAVAAITLLAASCSRKCEYSFETYATLYKTSYIINEDAGEVKVPVILMNSNGSEVQISVTANEGKAVEGTDFEITSPASGILTFSGETDTLDVVVKISDSFIGEFTGAKDFSLQIACITEGVTVGQTNNASISINDLDHPLAPYVGTWTGTTFEEGYTGQNMTLSFDITTNEDDVTKLNLTTVDPMMAAVVGYTKPFTLESSAVINADGTGQITIGMAQPTGFEYSYGPWVYMGLDAPTWDQASNYADIVFELKADGTMLVPNAFGIADDQYIWASYVGGFTLTKE